MRRRISIRGCVRPSVRPSVGPSVRLSRVIFNRVLGASCAVYPALLFLTTALRHPKCPRTVVACLYMPLLPKSCKLVRLVLANTEIICFNDAFSECCHAIGNRNNSSRTKFLTVTKLYLALFFSFFSFPSVTKMFLAFFSLFFLSFLFLFFSFCI